MARPWGLYAGLLAGSLLAATAVSIWWQADDGMLSVAKAARASQDPTHEVLVEGTLVPAREGPLVLSLDGDCWRDLAGTKLVFENPNPRAGSDSEALDVDQSGVIGDMTASRKCKIQTVGEEESRQLYEAEKEVP